MECDLHVGKPKKRISGKYCVAGGPGNVSCTNNSKTEGVSMHMFPREDAVRDKWVRFVRRHRADWQPSKTSVLCSVHFDASDFEQRLDLNIGDAELFKTKRWLKKNAVPTKDLVKLQENVVTPRERRKIIRNAAKQTTIHPEEPDGLEQNYEICSAPLSLPCDQVEAEAHLTISSPDPDPVPIDSLSNPSELEVSAVTCEKCQNYAERFEQLQDSCRKVKQRRVALQMEVNQLKKINKGLCKQLKQLQNDSLSSNWSEEEAGELFLTANTENDPDESLADVHSLSEDAPLEENLGDADREWKLSEEEAEMDDDGDDEGKDSPCTRNTIKMTPGTPCEDEPKFIVFYSALLAVFSLFCFNCKASNPSVSMESCGTMVTVNQNCQSCKKNFKWGSQPLILGRYPAGNLMLSFAILMAGASVGKILLVFKHMGLSVYESRTFFYHQSKLLFPVVLKYWENYQAVLIAKIKELKDAVWSGDGRFDSMGHSAKYGVYTLLCSPIMKIVHFELLQANQVGSSTAMELEGCKLCFQYLMKVGLAIKVFVSDRHRGIAKWIREKQPTVKHYFDQWHVAKGLVKKLLAASKLKGCEVISEWIKGVKNHIFWCSTSTKADFPDMILAKWKSFMRHISNKHTGHPDSNFEKCAHDESITPRKWITVGTKPYEKLQEILMKTSVLNDVKRLSPVAETSCLEGFHSTLNQWHPKMMCFSWLGTFCRHVLASVHFNENLRRDTKKTKEGRAYVNVIYPKFKMGDEVVREVAEPPSYGYVQDIKQLLFSMTKQERDDIRAKYKAKIPNPLNHQFPERNSKDTAIRRHEARKQLQTELFPSEAEQLKLQQQGEKRSTSSLSGTSSKRRRTTRTQ